MTQGCHRDCLGSRAGVMTYTTQVNVKKWRSVKFLKVSLAWCLWPRISVTWVAKAGESWAEGFAGLKRKFGGRLDNLMRPCLKELKDILTGVRWHLSLYSLMTSDVEHFSCLLATCTLLISLSHLLVGLFDTLLLNYFILCILYISNFC